MIGRGVQPGPTGAQHPGQELTGVVAPHHQHLATVVTWDETPTRHRPRQLAGQPGSLGQEPDRAAPSVGHHADTTSTD